MAAHPLTLEQINRLSRDTFVERLGFVFEHSPWVAAAAWDARPFASHAALHAAMCNAMWSATPEQQLALICAHPDLAGKAAIANELTDESTREQASAGLNRLTPAEFARFTALNNAYRMRFDFPFIICVREHTKASILASFEQRIAHTRDAELRTALGEIAKIAGLRLADAVTEYALSYVVEKRMPGRLTTHVLNTAQGRPAADVAIELWRITPTGARELLRSTRTNRDGRTDAPLLDVGELAVGEYELVFAVGAYFAAQGLPQARPPFLNYVPLRFAIADADAHYHVPLLVSPWAYSTYRGS